MKRFSRYLYVLVVLLMVFASLPQGPIAHLKSSFISRHIVG